MHMSGSKREGDEHIDTNVTATIEAVVLTDKQEVWDTVRLLAAYHADGPDRHEAVTPVAVGPGVPAGILSLLQYEHLTSHVLLLVANPAGDRDTYDLVI